MNENNSIADKIEQAIREMFAYANEFDSGIENYALLFDPKKSDTWTIVLFFADKDRLKASLDSGACYNIHQFLHNEISLIDSALPVSIRFDIGQSPSNEAAFLQLQEKHTILYNPAKNEEGRQQICSTCGHDWSRHRLSGYKSEGASVPQKGWMTCPEDDCFCFLTWDWDTSMMKK